MDLTEDFLWKCSTFGTFTIFYPKGFKGYHFIWFSIIVFVGLKDKNYQAFNCQHHMKSRTTHTFGIKMYPFDLWPHCDLQPNFLRWHSPWWCLLPVTPQGTLPAWMPSINKKCHQNEFLSIVEIITGRLLRGLYPFDSNNVFMRNCCQTLFQRPSRRGKWKHI